MSYKYKELLNTSVEEFIRLTSLDTRIENCLKVDESTKTVLDILELDTHHFNMLRRFGIQSWKKLMQALCTFGIRSCFDYPIAGNPQRYRLTKEYIAECKKEIIGD